MSGEQNDRISATSAIKFNADPFERANAYARNVYSTYRPTSDEIAMTKQVAVNDGYMARRNIFSFGTEGLNKIGPEGTNVCQNQYDDEGNMYQRSFSVVA